MNRKAKAKKDKAERNATASVQLHPFNNLEDWIGADFSNPPETKEWQVAFQKRIDDTFGVERGIVLAWSGDKRYWDGFYTDWFVNGLPKEASFEKRPILLWKSVPINDLDYFDIFPPRWLLLERHSAVQYADSWESASWVSDAKMVGGKKRVRPSSPPPEMFIWWKTIAEHEPSQLIGEPPPCCVRHAEAKSICFGTYRPPSEEDLIAVAGLRDFNKENNAQRPDEPLNANSLNRASRSTEFYYAQAALQKRKVMHDFMSACPEIFLNSSLKDRGMELSAREMDQLVAEACDMDVTENKILL